MDIQKGHVLYGDQSVTREFSDTEVFVLGIPGPDLVEITTGGLTHRRVLNKAIFLPPVSSPTLLMQRLAHSIAGAPKLFEELEQERDRYADGVTRANSKLSDIRKWMIATHEAGQLHRSDLDTFLAEFGMEPYRKRWTGTVTIIVSLSVDDAKDLEEARQAAYDWAEERIMGESGDNIDMPDIQQMNYNLAEDLT